ncbi:hypothetical protein LTR37_002873 [Vermiconidia calcicola]|uniref:Uncharacterized protein n=1 Tax=Vermiconidia calcicola TaxID=1690605 RepID=A0ACC3NSX4_9PEZI|nr:hypothetical protein LTR37_002873 [Vermiconidia calcicola]
MESDGLNFELANLLEEDEVKGSVEDESKRSLESGFDESDLLHTKYGEAISNSALRQIYRPVDSYEGLHRYDSDFKWSKDEERRVVRKIDWRICSWVCLMFLALQVDRGNIMQARSDDMLESLGLTADEYKTGQAIYFGALVLAELPSQLLAKRLGANVWLSVQMICWSLVASMQSGMYGPNSFWTTRALIGVFEAGFVPSSILYLSNFYTSTELPIRLSWLWIAYPTTKIVSALLAYSLVHLSGLYNIPGWRWLLGLEAALTCLLGCISYLYLPPSPTQTVSPFRGEEGWFTAKEEKIIVNRILRDDPSKGSTSNREPLTLRQLRHALSDYHMYPLYLLGLTWQMPMIPIANWMASTLHMLGLNPLTTSLLTLPSYAIWILNLLVFTRVSEWLNERILLSTVSQIWCLPLLIALETLVQDREAWQTWGPVMVLYAQPHIHAILLGLASRNAGSVPSRTVAVAVYDMCFQASNLVSLNIYRREDAPYYFRGNKILLCVAAWNIVLLVATKNFYTFYNRRRERLWNNMSSERKGKYLATTKDEGNKRLDFRFTH